MNRSRCALLAAILAVSPSLALAHGLIVFASVEGEEVRVEAKFSNGRPVLDGEVRVLDAEGGELERIAIEPGTETRFPLGPEAAGGLTIEVSAGDGHDDFWILTPDDIAAGRNAEVSQ